MRKNKKYETEDELIDDIFDYEDEEEEEEEEEPEIENENEEEEGEDQDNDWYLEGVAKTKEDAIKEWKRMKRYITSLERELKQIKNSLNNEEQKEVDKEVKDELDEITDEDIIVNPKDTIRKIVDNALNKVINQVNYQTAEQKWEALKEKAKQLYPDFDIDLNFDKINEVFMRYSPEYRAKNSFKILTQAIEELGGKRISHNKDVNRENGVIAEDGSVPSIAGKVGNIAEDIKKGILSAGHDYDLFS